MGCKTSGLTKYRKVFQEFTISSRLEVQQDIKHCASVVRFLIRNCIYDIYQLPATSLQQIKLKEGHGSKVEWTGLRGAANSATCGMHCKLSQIVAICQRPNKPTDLHDGLENVRVTIWVCWSATKVQSGANLANFNLNTNATGQSQQLRFASCVYETFFATLCNTEIRAAKQRKILQ